MASMSTPAGWEPYRSPKQRAGADAFHLSPFARLARTHVLVAAGDALVTIALANSLFFDLDPNDARWKVFLYLALTMAPLRGGGPVHRPRARPLRRWPPVDAHRRHGGPGARVLRDDRRPPGALLFPEAFAVLAMGKAYAVSRSAIVPTVVRDDTRAGRGQLEAPAAVRPGGPARRDPGRASPSRSPGPRGCSSSRWSPTLAATLAALRIPPPRWRRRRPPPRSRRSCTAPASAWRRRRWGWSAASSASSRSCCCSTCATTPPGRSAWCSSQRRRRAARLGAWPRRCGVAPPRSGCSMLALSVCVAGGLTAAWVGGLAGSMLLAAHRRDRVDLGPAGLRLAGAARCARRQPRPVVRVVRAAVPDRVGGRRGDPGAGSRSRSRSGSSPSPPSPASRCSPTSPASAPPTASTPSPARPPTRPTVIDPTTIDHTAASWETLTSGGAGGASAPRSPSPGRRSGSAGRRPAVSAPKAHRSARRSSPQASDDDR